MKRQKIPYALLPLVILILSGWWIADPIRYDVAPQGNVWIEGTSSIHDWRCDFPGIDGFIDTNAPSSAALEISLAKISIPVADIACKNGTMNKKALKALAADDHPLIRYELDQALLPSERPAGVFEIETTGKLFIAGVSRNIEMTVNGEVLDNGTIRYTGNTELSMTDYEISPPTALMGTLKTGDLVKIFFDFVASPMEESI